jgi:superfamily I DNA/RNA helicase
MPLVPVQLRPPARLQSNDRVDQYLWRRLVPITPGQIAQAQQAQSLAAQDAAVAIRLIAGPGTGKSATIERRVAHVLNNGANPNRVYVISFTRATCAELATRISAFCATQPCAQAVANIRISTMHSLALRILRSAAVLATLYPSDPIVLDDWERENIYDQELATALGCTPGRAEQVRLAHDAQWQTLNPQAIAQAVITNAERHGFDAFHVTRRNLYCCVLPGEVVYECVTRLQQGAIHPNQLPPIDHLIVDEYQDLNACDQEFIRRLTANGAIHLFYLGLLPHWLTGRHAAAVGRVRAIIQHVAGWTLQDTIGARAGDIGHVLSNTVFSGSAQAQNSLQEWTAFSASLPQGMTLEELLQFLESDDEASQRQILDAVNTRLGFNVQNAGAQSRIRILTMHGAKGLSGKIVFIPSAEQGIMPSFRAIHAVGLLNEQRRLFYVSLTRAKAACIITHSVLHTGAEAFLIRQQPQVRLPRSQFLNEMHVVSMNRAQGLNAAETAQIATAVNNL